MKVLFPTFGLEFGALVVEKSEVKVDGENWGIVSLPSTRLVAKDLVTYLSRISISL